MAQQLDFKPKPFNPLEEVRKKLEVGTLEHTTAVLNGYRLLQTADDHGRPFAFGVGLAGAAAAAVPGDCLMDQG